MAGLSSARVADVCVVVHATRDRVRRMTRAAFPKRRARVVQVRSAVELLRVMRAELVDAVLVDVAGGSDDAWLAAALAPAFVSAPFFAILPLRASEGTALARCASLGAAGVCVDGIDDAAVRELVTPMLFTVRFAAAFGQPPAELELTSPLQRAAWARIVEAGGRASRTEQLSLALGVTREHLSRTFGRTVPSLKAVIDFVRVVAAAELANNPGHQIRDVATVLGYASPSQLARASARVVGLRPAALAAAGGASLVARFAERHVHGGKWRRQTLSGRHASRTG